MVMLLFLPAFFAMLLAKTWFLAAVPMGWGMWRNWRLHPGDPPWRNPMVQLALAWLLVAAPTLWPGRSLAASPYFGSLQIPAYTCLDMLVISVGFLWFAVSFLRAWGHRPRRRSHAP
jgi:hypothetical protein